MPACIECGKPFARKHPSQKFCSLKSGRRVCKDTYHNARREVETKHGVAVSDDFVGITDREHDEIMSQDRDDF